jgi:hypothetical protein
LTGPLLISVTAIHEYPGPLLSVEAYLFALGSTLYKLMEDSRSYAGLSDQEILNRYANRKFPETQDL